MLQRLIKCLKPSEVQALEALLEIDDNKKFISINFFAERAGFAVSTVRDAMRIIEMAGYLETKKESKITKIISFDREKTKILVDEYFRKSCDKRYLENL